jgi:Right handed beta helix region
MTLLRNLLLAGLANGLCATALSAADYYVMPVKPGPVAGTPLAAISLQASTNPLGTNVNERGNTAGKWVTVGEKPAPTTTTTTAGVTTAAPAPTTAATTAAATTTAAAAAAPTTGTTFPSFRALITSGKLVGGDRVFLMGGYHGQLSIDNQRFTSPVTIAGMPGQTAQADAIDIFGSSNIAFRDLKVWETSTTATAAAALVRAYGGSSNLTFTNLDVRSTANATGYAQWNLTTWRASKQSGFQVDGKNVVVTGNRVTGIFHGIITLGANALVENNIIDGFSGDGMRALGDFSTVRGNKVQNCFQTSANHNDAFQSFSRGPTGKTGTGTVFNLTVENNKLLEWTLPGTNVLRCQLQGIGMFDGMFENLVIRNNLIAVSAYHGITVAGAKNALLTQNTVVHPGGLATSYPWIRISPHKNGTSPTNVMVANNAVNSLKVNPNTARNVAIANNIIVKQAAAEFTSVAKQDFTLLPSAKSANAASSAYATPKDIAGTPRPKGVAPDAGAYESQ